MKSNKMILDEIKMMVDFIENMVEDIDWPSYADDDLLDIHKRLALLTGYDDLAKDKSYVIIFDNGGGVTLQLAGKFAHHYDDAGQAARDLKNFLDDPDTSSWEGHDPQALVAPEQQDIDNGGLRVCYDIDRLNHGSSWINVLDFIEELETFRFPNEGGSK